ncbi:MAG: hypothetical protein IPH07_31980 [Deltaproteobacteria bacterium]|nr:hypothetical protein [Deltaproteobacteria bacterium]
MHSSGFELAATTTNSLFPSPSMSATIGYSWIVGDEFSSCTSTLPVAPSKTHA